jgi:hypothetical protein
MLKEIDYDILLDELNIIKNSEKKSDLIETAYHYGHFGFNSITADKLIKANVDIKHIEKHLVQLDSIYSHSYDNNNNLILNDYSNVVRGNYNYQEIDELEIFFPEYENDKREVGIFINLLPYIEIIKNRFNIKTIKIQCSERLKDLFDIYFPYIEIGKSDIKTSQYEVMEYVYFNGGSSTIRNSVKNISKRMRNNKNQIYTGINWFSNNIFDRYRSIPIGTLINTVGNHSVNLKVKNFQYNKPDLEIEIYNRYSKNKIVDSFDSFIDTPLIDLVDAVGECKLFVGIQSEASVIAYSLYGIPTIITAGSPNMYWYFLNEHNPYINVARMRFQGDYDHITNRINKLI